MIKGDTKVYSLYGSPIAHSLSPVIFNTTFEKLSLNRAYVPFEVKRDQLKQAVEAARTLGFDGFNVTMPLKTIIPDLLDRLDKSAQESGAVNTVAKTKSGLVGYNTDGEGAVRALRSCGFEPSNKRIVVLGAGGAAQALVHRFSSEHNRVEILNRTLERARELADRATGPGGVSFGKLDRYSFEKSLEKADLIVNATPTQTWALVYQLQVSPEKVSNSGLIFDLAYDRLSDQLPGGNGLISPLDMLLHQAALAYEIWLNEPAPLTLMRSALVDHLGTDWKGTDWK